MLIILTESSLSLFGTTLLCCLSQVSINNGLLSQTCSRYIRERGEVEKEYARSLRRLSTKYGSKEGDREERGTEKAFR